MTMQTLDGSIDEVAVDIGSGGQHAEQHNGDSSGKPPELSISTLPIIETHIDSVDNKTELEVTTNSIVHCWLSHQLF